MGAKDDTNSLIPVQVNRKQKKRHDLLIILTATLLIALSVSTVVYYYYLTADTYSDDSWITPLEKTEERKPNCALNVTDEEKFDCYPDAPVTEEQCLERGCCYGAVYNTDKSVNYPPLGIPYCYYPKDYVGYTIDKIEKTSHGYEGDMTRVIPSGFPDDIKNLKVTVDSFNKNAVHIKITDANSRRMEVPLHKPMIKQKVADDEKLYDIIFLENGTLSVIRKSSGVAVFNTDLRRLVYSNQFLQLSNFLPTKYIYGLGEHYDSFLKDLHWNRLTMFNRDSGPVPNRNLYGTQLMYLGVEETYDSHGIFLFNTHSTDVILQPTPALTYRTIGGNLDFFIFFGPSPDQVVQQYVGLSEIPFMPPYWSLGFHLCRYGYGSLNETRKVWKRTRDAKIPFDTQWNDIDYMDKRNDFTYDHTAYKGLPEFIEELHKEGMHYVIILDPGVSNAEEPGTYPPYDDGVKADVFVKNNDGTIFVGKVWNYVSTVFPDFLHPAIDDYWKEQLTNLHDQIPFDGVWIDMNEPSNFYDGQKDGCPNSALENPPYVPGGLEPLRSRTLCMTAIHNGSMPHYSFHNMYGNFEAAVTFFALAKMSNKRPFIISRSTFAFQGGFSGHWSGDIMSSWEDMHYSIIDLLNFNIFGVPMMGSDICGFRGNTTKELCARWTALGSFYPFSRNHNDLHQMDQDPVAMGEEVVTVARNTLTTRYRLLPYLYYLFYESHVYKKTVTRPLFFEFVDDPTTYDIYEQFMWGSALMIMPALYQGVTKINVYFPKAVWYDYYTGQRIQQSGTFATLPAPMDSINLAFRGGHVIPHQHNNLTTTESRLNKFYLLAGLDEKQSACGELYWDDGESTDVFKKNLYNLIRFEIKDNTLNSTIIKSEYDVNMDLDFVKICGLSASPSQVLVNGSQAHYLFDKYQCLTVSANVSLRESFNITWK